MEDGVLSSLKEQLPDLNIRTLEPGQEPELWKRLGITGVPAIQISVKDGGSVLLRGYTDAAKIQKAIEGLRHEGK